MTTTETAVIFDVTLAGSIQREEKQNAAGELSCRKERGTEVGDAAQEEGDMGTKGAEGTTASGYEPEERRARIANQIARGGHSRRVAAKITDLLIRCRGRRCRH